MSERGSVLIEMVVAGFLSIFLMLPLVSAIVRVADAQGTAAVAAHDAAVWVARHGVVHEEGAHIGAVEVEVIGDQVVAVASIDVRVVAILGVDMSITVRERAEVPISPYRSAP